MKTKRTPQEQYDSLNKTHKRIGRVLLCIMTPWCAFMWAFALLEYRPLWLSLVVFFLSVHAFTLNIGFSVFSVKLRKLKKLIDDTPRDDEGNHE